jgi:hypothetical protein
MILIRRSDLFVGRSSSVVNICHIYLRILEINILDEEMKNILIHRLISACRRFIIKLGVA